MATRNLLRLPSYKHHKLWPVRSTKTWEELTGWSASNTHISLNYWSKANYNLLIKTRRNVDFCIWRISKLNQRFLQIAKPYYEILCISLKRISVIPFLKLFEKMWTWLYVLPFNRNFYLKADQKTKCFKLSISD